MEKKIKRKRKINFQKIFCFISFVFLLVCIFWYGGRLVYFYKDSKKTIIEEATTFARVLKTQNHDKETLKKVNQDYYFYGEVKNNYLSYSNLLWRVIKVNEDNTVVVVTDNIIGTLAYGNTQDEYQNSNLIKWLNTKEENASSGVFERILNEKEKYLVKTSTCIDNIDNIEKVTCNKEDNNSYVGLLSVRDYLNTGGNKGFINNGRYSFLANLNNENEVWYVTDEGKLDVTNGEDILGMKAVITLSPNLELNGGTGTMEDPYKIEDSIGLIGSYVKLGEDMWRVYETNDSLVKLILQDTITGNANINNYTMEIDDKGKLKSTYSKSSYYHNDTTYGSLAYYLNHTYYNSLSYKNLIIENTYTNGFYSSDTEYKYEDISKNRIETKVALPSIEDVLFNDTLNEYFTDTGLAARSSLLYVRREKGMVSSKSVTTEAYVVPCISIGKDNLKVGSGSLEDPYRTE